MSDRRRTLILLLAAVGFGVAVGAIKGDSAGIRGDIGNLSAPWLLVALLPASGSRSLSRGALMGVVCSLAALLGFYATLTMVLSGHLGGGGYLRELGVELRANRVYLLAGLVSGPVFGVVGAWLGRHRSAWRWLLAGLLLAGEVVAVAALNGARLVPAPLYFSWGVSAWAPYVGEAALGVAIALAAAWSLWPRASRGA